MSGPEALAAVGDVELTKANTATTRAALPLVRSLILSGRLAHSGETELAEQVSSTRLLPATAGGLQIAHTGVRHDLLKAAAWAVADRAEPVTAPPSWFVY